MDAFQQTQAKYGEKLNLLLSAHVSVHNQSELRSINVGDVISPSDSVRNIGVIFDKHLSLAEHVNSVCKSSFYQLRRIVKIRKYLSLKTTQTLVHAFITSKIDNCNSLLFGIPTHLLKKLQYVQNAAARVITGSRKFDHITPVLKELHWLPVEQRIVFKVLLITFKALHGLAPRYISDIIDQYTSQPDR